MVFTLILVAGNFFYSFAIVPGTFSQMIEENTGTQEHPLSQASIEGAQWWSGMEIETMQITSYAGQASAIANFAKIYYEMGFAVFAPDNRAHGASEGNAFGMGWLDRKDYLQWMDFLVAEKGEQIEIILHGSSMGGATVSILSGENLLPNVKAIISDCAYDSVKNLFAYQLKNMFHLPEFPLLATTSLVCKLRAGYFLGDGDAIAQVAKCKVPILYIHGEDDTFVPSAMVYNLYDATDPSLREIWTVPGAEHGESIDIDSEGYVEHIKGVVDRVFIS